MLTAAAGCGGDGGGGQCPSTAVEIGTGTVEYESLADDSELELIAGVQGGFHFIVHARATSIVPGDPTIPGAPGNPSTIFVAYFENGDRASYDLPPLRLGYVPQPEDCTYQLPSGRVLRILDDRVDRVVGSRIRIALRVEDDRGAVAIDERWITATENRPADAGPGPDGGPLSDAGPVDASPADAPFADGSN